MSIWGGQWRRAHSCGVVGLHDAAEEEAAAAGVWEVEPDSAKEGAWRDKLMGHRKGKVGIFRKRLQMVEELATTWMARLNSRPACRADPPAGEMKARSTCSRPRCCCCEDAGTVPKMRNASARSAWVASISRGTEESTTSGCGRRRRSALARVSVERWLRSEFRLHERTSQQKDRSVAKAC